MLFVMVFLQGIVMKLPGKILTIAVLIPVALLITLNIASAQTHRDREMEQDSRHALVKNWEDDWKGTVLTFSSLDVTKRNLPPPGECRIWIPGVPAGQQPPPISCASASYRIPAGAWIITHAGDYYTVTIYSRKRLNTIDEERRYLLR